MAKKQSKIYYFYPLKEVHKKKKIANLTLVLEGLVGKSAEERILKDGDGNIQLKKIDYNEKEKRWDLAFLKNQIDAPFKTRLDDSTESAEELDEDEFVGQECCVIYDENTGIVALQNNRNSISPSGFTQFIIKYSKHPIILSAITYKEKYCEISDDDYVSYKSIIINYTEIGELEKLAESTENESLRGIAKIANDLSALTGKIELGVGRGTKRLDKLTLKSIVSFFKGNPKYMNGLKVKMDDCGTIRTIDLISNKVYSTIEITVTKEEPKTFNIILYKMNIEFDEMLNGQLNKCNKFVEE